MARSPISPVRVDAEVSVRSHTLRTLVAMLAVVLASFAPVDHAPVYGPLQVKTWRESGPAAESVDVLFVGDGYTSEQLEGGLFWGDVDRYAQRLLDEVPFSTYRDRFNIRALFLESPESGCDPDPHRDQATTALETYFDSWRGRVLRFRHERLLTDLVAEAGDVDIVFVMVNTTRYGGSGSVLRGYRPQGAPCPAPVFAARHPEGFSIAVHELGHSFADLTDEYSDASLHREYRLPHDDHDLDHPNATRAGAFDGNSFESLRKTLKWGRFLELPGAGEYKWVHEGSYYRDKGVFRPWETCKMRAREDPFCPVCAEAIARSITAVCGDEWDAAGYHDQHPLTDWGAGD